MTRGRKARSRVKKLRGGRRYYERLQKRAAAFQLDLSESHWYDLWHQHFDLRGYSRMRPRVRRAHLAALFTSFRRALQQAANSQRRIQVFVSIAPPSEAEQDALYVHTPNPNGTPFPHAFDGFGWNVPAPPFLREFVAGEEWEIGVAPRGWWVVRLSPSRELDRAKN